MTFPFAGFDLVRAGGDGHINRGRAFVAYSNGGDAIIPQMGNARDGPAL
jgi:hypothetical protein